jgi:hypothetical protein
VQENAMWTALGESNEVVSNIDISRHNRRSGPRVGRRQGRGRNVVDARLDKGRFLGRGQCWAGDKRSRK